MAKQPNLSNVTNVLNSQTILNSNNDAIETAFDNTISRDGSSPNQMEFDFDLNSNDLLNGGEANFTTLKVGGTSVIPNDVAFIPNWEGAWLTATAYVVNDLVREGGSTYICPVAHTSGTFSTDLSSAKWELFAQQGASGAGSGDMVAANNLSDLADTDTALSNLGGLSRGIQLFKSLTVGQARGLVEAQKAHTILDQITGLTQAANKIPMFSGASTSTVIDFLDEDTLVSDSATAVATQQSIKAYIDAQIAAISSVGWGYTSAETLMTISTGGNAFTHGLGAVPTSVELDLVCSTSDVGFVPGDKIVDLGSTMSVGANRGICAFIPNGNTTEIHINIGSALRVFNPSGVESPIDITKWRLVVKAKL